MNSLFKVQCLFTDLLMFWQLMLPSSEPFLFIARCRHVLQRRQHEQQSAADPGGVQGVRTPALLIRMPFWKEQSQ